MRTEFLKNDMRELGVDPDRVLHGPQFLEDFSRVDLGGYASCSITVYLRQQPGAEFFERTPEGNVLINLAGFRRIHQAAHIYVHYIIRALKKHHVSIKFVVHWESIDLYISNIFTFEDVPQAHHHIGLFNHFHRLELGSDIRATCGFPTVKLGSEPVFFARPGNVELRAVRTILRYPEKLEAICVDIAENWASHEFMYKPNTSSDAAVADHHYSIRQLITNAGMYGTDANKLLNSINSWANRYISGLFGSNEIFLQWSYGMHSHAVRVAAADRGLTFRAGRRANFGTMENFYDQMAGKTVLMISPFARACMHSVESGNIKKLWKHRKVPDFKLIGLSAYITTYPNRPHESWLDTFETLCQEIDAIVEKNEVDLVIGSCGCYGVPLLDYCNKRHGMSAVYYGNFMHIFFGIRQNDFVDHMADANAEFWTDPLYGTGESPKNLSLIDDGRYVNG